MTDKTQTNDLKSFLKDHIAVINIVDLIKYYEERIGTLERELRTARSEIAETLFGGMRDED